MLRLLAGAALNAAAAAAVYFRGSLTAAGALAAALLGFGVFYGGGLYFWALLMVFFVSSTLLTRLKEERKAPYESLTGKGGRRDLAQVLANGGVALAAALAYRLTGRGAALLAYAGALAAANADTWASELGLLSRRQPVSILTLRRAQRGASGAVSAVGLAASVGGSLLVAAAFAAGAALRGLPPRVLSLGFAAVAAAGFLGAIADSVCGAALQGRFLEAGQYSERRSDAAGAPNTLTGGLAFVNNDVVNLLCTFVGAASAYALGSLLRV
jgi:uncharacterized protein (TIGR00297 family)